MKLVVAKSELQGEVAAPPSKSHTHRALILAALANGASVVSSPLHGEDTDATLDAVKALGAEVSCTQDGICIHGGCLHPPAQEIDCKNSGTSIRMLAGIAAQLTGGTSFTGDTSLCSRPMKPLLDAFVEIGVSVTAVDGGFAIFPLLDLLREEWCIYRATSAPSSSLHF